MEAYREDVFHTTGLFKALVVWGDLTQLPHLGSEQIPLLCKRARKVVSGMEYVGAEEFCLYFQHWLRMCCELKLSRFLHPFRNIRLISEAVNTRQWINASLTPHTPITVSSIGAAGHAQQTEDGALLLIKPLHYEILLDKNRQMEQQAKEIEMVAQFVADHLSNKRYISHLSKFGANVYVPFPHICVHYVDNMQLWHQKSQRPLMRSYDCCVP